MPTKALLSFRFAGIGDGIERKILVRISHEHAATQFLQPVSAEILDNLVIQGILSESDKELAKTKSVATDLMVETESFSSPGKNFSHLFFALRSLRVRFLQPGEDLAGLGLCGGIATPESLSSALAVGADFVITTDINRLSIEAEQAEKVREYLLAARPDDFTMVSMPEYFGTAARVPIFKFGSVFAIRATRMDQIYRRVSESGYLSSDDREFLLKQWPDQKLKDELSRIATNGDEILPETNQSSKLKEIISASFLRFLQDSLELLKAVVPGREKEYQIRCSADTGVFNEWRKGGNLGQAANITVTQIAHALLSGAALSRRILQLKEKGIPLPARVLRMSVQQQEKNGS
jgi:trans-AT polyketide synthase/acyltransferase/oxidoreductase domain-containing protein